MLKTVPLKIILFAGLLAGFVFACSLYISLTVPRVGMSLSYSHAGEVTIEHIEPDSPAARAGVTANSIITAIGSGKNNLIPLDRNAIINDPDILPDFAAINHYFQKQAIINQIFANPTVYLQTNHRQFFTIGHAERFKVFWLPGWYWWMMAMGSGIFIFAASVYGHDKSNSSAVYLLVTGTGLWLASVLYATYGSRELATLPIAVYSGMISGKHLFLCLFAIGGVTLIWRYPNRFRLSAGYWLYVATILVFWLVNSFQFFELPVHTYYLLPYLVPTLTGVALTLRQYLVSRTAPVNRAIVLWFSSGIWISILIIYLLHILPTLITGYPYSNLVVQYTFCILFLGFGFGVIKYRLFDIDRWWFNTWLMILLATAILLIDVLVAWAWSELEQQVFIVALLICFWIYFPAREKLWRMIFKRKGNYQINDYLAEMISLFSGPCPGNEQERYLALFRAIFNPAFSQAVEHTQTPDTVAIQNHGLTLTVPVTRTQAIQLSGKNRGARLFTSQDAAFSESTVTIVKRIINLTDEHKKVEANERARIMRDLHDDVGSRLLDLIHGTSESKAVSLAKDTLNALRLSVMPLHSNEPRFLDSSIAQWQTEIRTRLENTGINLQWQIHTTSDATLDIRVYINTTKVLRELTTNMLKHSKTRTLKLSFNTSRHSLKIVMQQEGNAADPASFKPGTGLNNIAGRMQEINGQFAACRQQEQGELAVSYQLTIPLETP